MDLLDTVLEAEEIANRILSNIQNTNDDEKAAISQWICIKTHSSRYKKTALCTFINNLHEAQEEKTEDC